MSVTPVAVSLLYANDCPHCGGKGRVPGGPYRAQGEIVRCWHCNGAPQVARLVPWPEFVDMIREDIKATDRAATEAVLAYLAKEKS